MTAKAHEIVADLIADCVRVTEALCRSDPAPVMVGACSDLRRALSAVRDRAAALRVRGAGQESLHHKQAPSDVLQDIYARRIRYARPRRRILAGLLGGRG